jgi:hypothetical protein
MWMTTTSVVFYSGPNYCVVVAVMGNVCFITGCGVSSIAAMAATGPTTNCRRRWDVDKNFKFTIVDCPGNFNNTVIFGS